MTDRELLEQALEVLVQHVKHYDYEQFTSVCELEPAKDLILALRARLTQPEQEPVLQDIEQYRMQMASISTAAIGYWKEGDGIHPDYDTPALRDVAMLYAKYDALYKAQPDPLQRLTDVQQEIEAALAPEQKPVDIGTEWTSCVKLPVTVHVRQQRPGETHVSTREGITPVKPDDLIMRGVSGEEYPIGREIFERTYQLGEAQTKPEQKPVAWLYSEGLTSLKAGKCWTAYGTQQDKDNSIPLYTAPQQREWQGLTDEEISAISKSIPGETDLGAAKRLFAREIEAKLKEKNT